MQQKNAAYEYFFRLEICARAAKIYFRQNVASINQLFSLLKSSHCFLLALTSGAVLMGLNEFCRNDEMLMSFECTF